MEKYSQNDDSFMPMGLAMSLSMNSKAIKAFSVLSAEEQNSVMNKARHVDSRHEMDQIVNSLCEK